MRLHKPVEAALGLGRLAADLAYRQLGVRAELREPALDRDRRDLDGEHVVASAGRIGGIAFPADPEKRGMDEAWLETLRRPAQQRRCEWLVSMPVEETRPTPHRPRE